MGKPKWRVLSQTEELMVSLGTHSHFRWGIPCFHHCGSGSLSLFVNQWNACSVPGTVFGAGNMRVLALGMTHRRCSGISKSLIWMLAAALPGTSRKGRVGGWFIVTCWWLAGVHLSSWHYIWCLWSDPSHVVCVLFSPARQWLPVISSILAVMPSSPAVGITASWGLWLISGEAEPPGKESCLSLCAPRIRQGCH